MHLIPQHERSEFGHRPSEREPPVHDIAHRLPAPESEIESTAAFVSPTGAILFTDRRILLVAREHLLEARVETSSYPYREVRRFALVEGAKGFLQLRIWIGDEDHPLHLRARPGADLRAIQQLLAEKLA